MIVKQKEMDKRVYYKINLETIFASASSMGISAIKNNSYFRKGFKKSFKITHKKKFTQTSLSIFTKNI